jgi:hypothetical protein
MDLTSGIGALQKKVEKADMSTINRNKWTPQDYDH